MKSLKNIAWFIMLIIACMLVLASCATSDKTKSRYKKKTVVDTEQKKGIDTSKVSATNLQQQAKTETSTGSAEEAESSKEFNIEFNLGGNGTAEDYTGKTLDTIVHGTKIKTNDAASIKFNPDGSFETKGNIKNINYKETGSKKKRDSSHTINTTDTKLAITDAKKGIDTSTSKGKITTEITSINKHKETTSYWGWLWFLLIPVVWLLGWYFGLWPLLPKRKKKEEYPVKYTNYEPPKPPIK